MPSIAAVAEVEMVTCAEGERSGTFISPGRRRCHAAKEPGARPGHHHHREELFRRVPARLKFLKSIPTESSHVANVVSQYALAFPEVAFSLTVDGKENLRTSGKGRLLDAIIDVYGVEIAGKMLPVDERRS